MQTLNLRADNVTNEINKSKIGVYLEVPPVGLHNEALLLDKCIKGDRKAWDELVKLYEKQVYRFAYMLCKDREDASDIVVHVFVRIFQSLYQFRHEASFSCWVFRIVRNTYLDLCVRPTWKSSVKLETELAGDAEDGGSRLSDIADGNLSPETLCINKEIADTLNHAINYLPAYQREVIHLFHADGKSYEEIAVQTGLSIGTVKSRLSRARNMLRERLSPMHDSLLLA